MHTRPSGFLVTGTNRKRRKVLGYHWTQSLGLAFFIVTEMRRRRLIAALMGATLGLDLCIVVVSSKQSCDCKKIEVPDYSEAQEYLIPKSFSSRELPKQLVLVKVPETGSSTAANLLSLVADKVGAPTWQSGSKVDFERVISGPSKSSPKWSLGHYPYGEWVADHFDHPLLVTTAREPLARVASHTEKRAQRGEIDCDDLENSASSCSCEKGLGVAVKFWGVKQNDKLSLDDMARAVVHKFDSIWITERYNESLVAFAVSHRLGLGDVMPPLAKYHRPHDQPVVGALSLRSRIHSVCADQARHAADVEIERRVYALASSKLDHQLKALTKAGIDANRLVKSFTDYLDIAMSLGKTRPKYPVKNSTQQTTLLLDDCTRRCVADALNANVKLVYESSSSKKSSQSSSHKRHHHLPTFDPHHHLFEDRRRR